MTQKPAHWLESEPVQKFISTVSTKLKVGNSDLLYTVKGRTGGTYAHWQIALAYAKYLSPELHMFVNECFKDRMEEENNPELAINRGRERAVKHWKKSGMSEEWICERLKATKCNNMNFMR